MKIRKLFEVSGLMIGLGYLITFFGTYFYFYFIRRETRFTVYFNIYYEAIPEIALFLIAIIGIGSLLFKEVRK